VFSNWFLSRNPFLAIKRLRDILVWDIQYANAAAQMFAIIVHEFSAGAVMHAG
jgi:hypothetical protein